MLKVSGTADSSDPIVPLKVIDLPDPIPSHIPEEQYDDFLADLDITKFLFVYTFNLAEDGLMDKYREAQQNLHLWQVWEAAITEVYVKTQTKDHNLPSDSLMESILARNSYRAKVIETWRERGAWYVHSIT